MILIIKENHEVQSLTETQHLLTSPDGGKTAVIPPHGSPLDARGCTKFVSTTMLVTLFAVLGLAAEHPLKTGLNKTQPS
jgi:hypothetical protein